MPVTANSEPNRSNEHQPVRVANASPDAAPDPPAAADGKLVIKYHITLDDVTAFHRHVFAHSTTLRNQKYMVIAFAGIVTLGGGLTIVEFPVAARIFGSLIVTAIFAVFFHFFQRWSVERHAKRMVLSGSTEGVLGAHQLELDEVSLVERTDVNEMRQALAAIDKIEETEHHAFVYISAMHAHLIPKHRVDVGHAEQFVELLREMVTEAKRGTRLNG